MTIPLSPCIFCCRWGCQWDQYFLLAHGTGLCLQHMKRYFSQCLAIGRIHYLPVGHACQPDPWTEWQMVLHQEFCVGEGQCAATVRVIPFEVVEGTHRCVHIGFVIVLSHLCGWIEEPLFKNSLAMSLHACAWRSMASVTPTALRGWSIQVYKTHERAAKRSSKTSCLRLLTSMTSFLYSCCGSRAPIHFGLVHLKGQSALFGHR